MKKIAFSCCILLCLLMAVNASADTLNFDPVNTFSGTAPAGSLTAVFTDVSGGVQLVITSNLASGENLDPGHALYFNINPADTSLLSGLTFTLQANTGFSQAATVQVGEDAFKADGDGYYDILFTYDSSTKAFTTGESQTYLISGSINASDFSTFLSSPGGDNGTWLAAVHVQNTPSGGGGSAWVGAVADPTSVPEPATMLLLSSGLIGLCGFRKKFRK